MRVSFASRLRNNERLIGTLLSLNSAELAEIMVKVGYDWLFIDAEHGAFSPQDTQAMLQSAGNCPCVIRIPSQEETWIKKSLDMGSAGIIVPQVNTAEEAEQIIRWAKYAPSGTRGVGIGRAHSYGMEFEDYLKHANDSTAVIIQAETPAALENIDSITDVKGIDAILIGPYDLSTALGKPGQLDDPVVVDAFETIRKCCQSKGISLGYFGITADAVRPYMDNGFNLIAIGVDTLFVTHGAQEMLNALREQ